ncbi:TPA: hypothetical protein SG801_001346 [Campylobacter coli]|uniref:hypothetical protein n=1 Tax=Campylobacter coli TaxID=195 RepID=UPI00073E5619|nr:hypothetical protein [Campylobacter coli]EAJ2196084.1 hypothetical protein [Campylobacter jejuni]EDP7298794.1 hypothetical protein [Campylobacter jejuni]EGS0795816.1 hypothetical protein [Campylobacter coli]HDZ4368594.1 hypothetical protein [Campylobacter jejuni]HDZ4377011.1 hypothetical protein [Campylobacter jejuni]
MNNDVKISQITNIPYFTIREWKQKENNWRIKLYLFLKNTNEEELKKIFSDAISYDNIGLHDSRIADITKIPLATLNNWKKDESSYRKKIYYFLKGSDESILRKIFI